MAAIISGTNWRRTLPIPVQLTTVPGVVYTNWRSTASHISESTLILHDHFVGGQLLVWSNDDLAEHVTKLTA